MPLCFWDMEHASETALNNAVVRRKGETSNSCMPGLDICPDNLVLFPNIHLGVFPNPQVQGRNKQVPCKRCWR